VYEISAISGIYLFYTRLDNGLNVCLHNAAGCSTGYSTYLTTGCIV